MRPFGAYRPRLSKSLRWPGAGQPAPGQRFFVSSRSSAGNKPFRLPHRARSPAHPQNHLRLLVVPSAPARDHRRVARRARCVCPAAHRRRQVAVLPVARAAPRRPHRRRLAADRIDEGSGGPAPGRGHRRHVSQLLARRPRVPLPAGRPAPRRVAPPLRRARTPHARRLAGKPAGVERRRARHRRRIAFPSGATISARSTASSPACAPCCPTCQ